MTRWGFMAHSAGAYPDRVSRACIGILVVLGTLALLTPFLPIDDPDRTRTALALAPPTWTGDSGFWHRDWERSLGVARHVAPWDRALIDARTTVFDRRCLPALCGRDSLGRCVLARLLWGARLSLAVGLFAGLISLACGVAYGAIAGYCGGWIDQLLMRCLDVLYGIPFIFVVIFLITVFRKPPDETDISRATHLPLFFAVIGLVSWLTMARVVRGQVISLREREFVTAARALGARSRRILWRHLLPQMAPIILVCLTLTVPRVMLLESFVSFLGLGVEPPDVSWGLLARDAFEAMNPIDTPWWLVLWPTLALGTTLTALGVLGDTLQASASPRGRAAPGLQR